jgi:hypothetical protein
MLIPAFLVIQNGHSLTLKTRNQTQHLNWFGFLCTIHGIYMLCVMCVVIVMVVGADIGMHNKDNFRLWANLFLHGPIKNIIPQIFETHPTLRQHKNHMKKAFDSKLFIKKLSKPCRIQNYN